MLSRIEADTARRRVRRHRRHRPSTSVLPQPALPPGTDTLPQIDHIVILMMENHSYDNYLGMLGRGDGLPLDEQGLPSATNTTADGTVIGMRRFAGTAQQEDVPSQSWRATHLQCGNGSCDGFARSVEQLTPGADVSVPMTYFTEEDLPFYYGLARTFPLATRWFSSCLGPTFPNRRFLIAGTAHGLIDDFSIGILDYPKTGTIFDDLIAYGISWINYHHLSHVRIHWRRLSRARGLQFVRRLGGLLSGIVPQVKRAAESKLQATAELYPLGLLRSVNHLRPMDAFWRDAAEGTLPSISIVDPDFGGCSEENPQDVQVGEGFAAGVINAVMTGKAWEKTLLIWLYDEHGGYYDHVPPPPAVAPDGVPGQSPLQRFRILWPLRFTSIGRRIEARDAGPATYDRLGFRVPAVIVSPYAKPGYVTDQVYDHTSILKLIERKWNLPPLTRRDAAAADPLDALDLENPPHFRIPPKLPAPAKPWRA